MKFRRHQPRFALTLMELLLVLAILVIVLGIAAPTLFRAFETQRLQKSADLVRTELLRARNRAIRSGEDYVFYFGPRTGNFGSAPYSSTFSGGVTQGQMTEGMRTSKFEFGDGLLPEKVLFVSGQVDLDSRDMAMLEESGDMTGNVGVGNSEQIIFYPDGSCQDGKVIITLNEELYMQIGIRGLTGTVKVSDILSLAEAME